MSLIRVKPLALIALVSTCQWSQAVELGNMEINSGIDQKLNADIPLNLAPNESTAKTKVKIISSKNRNGNGDDLTTPQIEINSDDGRLKLTSKQAIEASHLDLVLEVKTDKDTQYKQFSIDLSRASEDSPLIVSPKNSIDKKQEPTQPPKKYYRKKWQAPLTTSADTSTPAQVKTEKPSQKPIDNATNVTAPITNPALATTDAASTQTLPDAPQFQESVIKQPSTIALSAPETPQAQLKSWIKENSVILIAFLTGILGVLTLQKLLSGNKNPSQPVQPKKSTGHDKYQALQETLGPEFEQPFESNPKLNIANDVALFEELLRSRMQQFNEVDTQQANRLHETQNTQQADLDEDDFGFDFDLPDSLLTNQKLNGWYH